MRGVFNKEMFKIEDVRAERVKYLALLKRFADEWQAKGALVKKLKKGSAKEVGGDGDGALDAGGEGDGEEEEEGAEGEVEEDAMEQDTEPVVVPGKGMKRKNSNTSTTQRKDS